ncbi:hypothetical protein, partial [Streptomyces avidinii]
GRDGAPHLVGVMDDIAAQVDDYLDRYAGTLTSYDAQAAAALWGSPGMILNDEQGAGVLESREAMTKGWNSPTPSTAGSAWPPSDSMHGPTIAVRGAHDPRAGAPVSSLLQVRCLMVTGIPVGRNPLEGGIPASSEGWGP